MVLKLNTFPTVQHGRFNRNFDSFGVFCIQKGSTILYSSFIMNPNLFQRMQEILKAIFSTSIWTCFWTFALLFHRLMIFTRERLLNSTRDRLAQLWKNEQIYPILIVISFKISDLRKLKQPHFLNILIASHSGYSTLSKLT